LGRSRGFETSTRFNNHSEDQAPANAQRSGYVVIPQRVGGVETHAEVRILQLVKNLIGEDIIAPGNLGDENTRESILRADYPLLVVASVPALALLLHHKPR